MRAPVETQWEKEMRSVLGTKACGSTQEEAMLPLHWKSGWSPATLKAFLQEAVHCAVPGVVPRLQSSLPGNIIWQKFTPGTLTDAPYDLTLEKLAVGGAQGTIECLVTQERLIAYKCYIFVRIWMAQRAQLWHAHHEALFRARFTDESLEVVKNSRTFAELCMAIESLVEEPISTPPVVIVRSPIYPRPVPRQRRTVTSAREEDGGHLNKTTTGSIIQHPTPAREKDGGHSNSDMLDGYHS
ncbi:hypothetical protein PG999_014104 [Apiospora kogelbergensis]|uniref:Uncharacterized protein n=1 Tax=Apiospora kogelbergensis TaxID=1337665 RepID=A0AAW0Q8S1_9PEZI